MTTTTASASFEKFLITVFVGVRLLNKGRTRSQDRFEVRPLFWRESANTVLPLPPARANAVTQRASAAARITAVTTAWCLWRVGLEETPTRWEGATDHKSSRRPRCPVSELKQPRELGRGYWEAVWPCGLGPNFAVDAQARPKRIASQPSVMVAKNTNRDLTGSDWLEDVRQVALKIYFRMGTS